MIKYIFYILFFWLLIFISPISKVNAVQYSSATYCNFIRGVPTVGMGLWSFSASEPWGIISSDTHFIPYFKSPLPVDLQTGVIDRINFGDNTTWYSYSWDVRHNYSNVGDYKVRVFKGNETTGNYLICGYDVKIYQTGTPTPNDVVLSSSGSTRHTFTSSSGEIGGILFTTDDYILNSSTGDTGCFTLNITTSPSTYNYTDSNCRFGPDSFWLTNLSSGVNSVTVSISSLYGLIPYGVTLKNIFLYTRATEPYYNPSVPLPPGFGSGNLYGRIFVDSDGDLYRDVGESLVGTSSPQIYMQYRRSGGSWTNISNTKCCTSTWADCTGTNGPYAVSSVAAASNYELHVWMDGGLGWSFSEPVANTFGVYPIPTTNCTFGSGTGKAGVCSDRDGSGNCFNFTVTGVNISAGATTYLWFGVKQTEGTIGGYIFMDDNGDGLKDAGEEYYNIEDDNGIISVTGQGATIISDSDYDYSYGLSAATYTVGLSAPAGYAVTGWNDGTTASLGESSTDVEISGPGDDETVNFGIAESTEPWFLIDKGDIGSPGAVIVGVPVGGQLFSEKDGGVISEGAVSYDPGDLGPEGVFRVDDYSESLTTLSFNSLWDISLSKSEWDSILTPIESLESGSYYVTGVGDIDIGDISLSGKNLVIFAGDKTETVDININGDIEIDDDSSLILIASGDIVIDPTVTSIKGYMYAKGDIYTGTVGEGSDDVALTIYGSMVTSITGQVYLQRDLGSGANPVSASESFYFQPKYYIMPYEDLEQKFLIWTETY